MFASLTHSPAARLERLVPQPPAAGDAHRRAGCPFVSFNAHRRAGRPCVSFNAHRRARPPFPAGRATLQTGACVRVRVRACVTCWDATWAVAGRGAASTKLQSPTARIPCRESLSLNSCVAHGQDPLRPLRLQTQHSAL